MDKSANNIFKLMETLLGRQPAGVFSDDEPYEEFLAATSPTDDELDAQRQAAARPVTFGIAVVGESDEESLRRTAASLSGQTYSSWKLFCGPLKEDFDYILHIRAGDTLAPHALHEFAAAAKERHDLIYCDEDSIEGGRRCAPVFKPELNRFTQLSCDMLGSGVAVSRELYEAAGGMTGGSGNARYDFNLRCMDGCESPHHIPKPLYTAAKPLRPDVDALIMVQRHAARDETVLPGRWSGSFIVEKRLRRCSCTLIIRCRNGCDELMKLLGSIDRAHQSGGTCILIADQGSADRRTLNYYDILERNGAAKVVRCGDVPPGRLMNLAALNARSDALIFMDSCMEALSVNWAEGLLSQAMRTGVGAVAPRMIDGHGRLLHTGTVIGVSGWQGSAYAGEPDSARTDRRRLLTETLRAVSAASLLTMAVASDTFFGAGCFDESFGEAGADTELCLRLERRGYTTLYQPAVTMRCTGRPCRISSLSEKEQRRCYDVMRAALLTGDRYYSPNYDYSSPIPRAAANPAPPIELNPLYSPR